MTLDVVPTPIRSIRRASRPATVRADDGDRHRSIGSLQALGLALVVAVVTSALLRLVL